MPQQVSIRHRHRSGQVHPGEAECFQRRQEVAPESEDSVSPAEVPSPPGLYDALAAALVETDLSC